MIDAYRKQIQNSVGEFHSDIAAGPGRPKVMVSLRFTVPAVRLAPCQPCTNSLVHCSGDIWWVENEHIHLACYPGQQRLKCIAVQNIES